ncbi:MAG: LacI family DNA-binding transcriptional regulator, partial [Oscillospiraceae bacterium]|nr:LacI family DNA-binding transcriptional regulator [Oscillospiraceae bacterium]
MIGGKKITALCTSRIYDPQEHEFIRLLSEFLRANNNILFIYTLNTDLYWEEDNKNTEAKLFGLMDYSVIDTVIVMDEKIKSRKVAEKIISSANKRGVPVAVVDGSYPDTVSVDFDYGRGFEQIVRHVVEFHKAKKLHFIAGIKGNKFSDERIE